MPLPISLNKASLMSPFDYVGEHIQKQNQTKLLSKVIIEICDVITSKRLTFIKLGFPSNFAVIF